MHVLLDYTLAGVLVASPFLFGFTDESAPTAFFIVLGVAHLLITIGTRFRDQGGVGGRTSAACRLVIGMRVTIRHGRPDRRKDSTVA